MKRPRWSSVSVLFVPGVLVAVVVLAAVPFLSGKYVFLLDTVFGPAWNPVKAQLFGFRTSAYGGSLPLTVLLAGVAEIAGPSAAQKVLLVGVVTLTAAVGFLTLPGDSRGRLYGAVLLLVNPFVYTRLLVGHWAVVWGTVALVVVLKTYVEYVERGQYRDLLLAVGAVTLLGFNSHLLYAASVLLGSLTLFRYAERRESLVVRRGLTVAAVATPVNAYWLGPAFAAGGERLSGISAADLLVYAPRGDSSSVLYATVTMHGFWREGITHAKDLVPPVQPLYTIILFLAVFGAVTHLNDEKRGYVVRALILTAVLALLFGAGVSGPAEPAFRWLFRHVPFFGGLRDSNKLVAFLVVSYAYLGSLGVTELVARVRRRARTGRLPTVVLVLVVLVPLAYTFPMVTGYGGQVQGQDYPAEWYEVDRLLNADPGTYTVLFLPWHQYMDYSWLDGRHQRIVTPARQFFSKPVIQGDNVEAGPVYSTSGNPVSGYVEYVFGLGPSHDRREPSNVGELLAQVDVKYVLLTKEADWRSYDAVLREQHDVRLVHENDYFKVYRNERAGSRSYATDRVTYVRNLSEFLESSRRHDADGVYALDPSKVGRTASARDVERERLQADERSPVHYRLDGTSHEHTVFVTSQLTAGDGWQYDGKTPTHRHLGIHPVFESEPDGGDVRYAPFYRVFLPSYAVSSLTVVLLFWYGRTNGALLGVERGRWRRAWRERICKSDERDR